MHFNTLVLAQALDPLKILTVLLIMYFIKNNRHVYILIVSGIIFGIANIWLVKAVNPVASINIITFMLASVISAHLLHGAIFLLKRSRGQALHFTSTKLNVGCKDCPRPLKM